MINLIIVESFSKTKTIYNYINNYNNDKYFITCSLGHICNLPKNNLGIDIDTWKCCYEVSNKKIVKDIRNLVKKSDNIYIASDPDIEGEAIAYHIKNHIKDLLKNKNCYRIKFNEITKNSIINAINNPLKIDINKVNAQETRRILDRLIGFKLSPLLWKQFNDYHLSVGRVQTVALSICIDKLNEINNIINDNTNFLWNVFGSFKINDKINEILKCKLYDKDNKTLIVIKNEKDCLIILNQLINLSNNSKWSIKLNNTNFNKIPKEPYTTTSLQKDAYNTYKYNSNKTMLLSKLLYELGLITYMRTDSINISEEFKKNIWNYIEKEYGYSFINKRIYHNNISNAQEAHEAIRITNIDLIDLSNYNPNITSEHINLYNLIWKRTIASQMIDAKYCNLEIIIYNKKYNFITSKTILENEGYLRLYNKDIEIKDKEKYIEDIINYYKNVNIEYKDFECIPYISKKPSLFNEIELIKDLEKNGIGRPSTYSGIIDKLYEKKYVRNGTNPIKELNINSFKILNDNKNIITNNNLINIISDKKDLLVPTDIGIKVIEYLKNTIPFILDKKLTADMEDNLDLIINKKAKKNNILNKYYISYIKKFNN